MADSTVLDVVETLNGRRPLTAAAAASTSGVGTPFGRGAEYFVNGPGGGVFSPGKHRQRQQLWRQQTANTNSNAEEVRDSPCKII